MKPIDANDAAFPSFPMEGGLTKREYFAALAMQGALIGDPDGECALKDHARYAVRAADALIAALEGE